MCEQCLPPFNMGFVCGFSANACPKKLSLEANMLGVASMFALFAWAKMVQYHWRIDGYPFVMMPGDPSYYCVTRGFFSILDRRYTLGVQSVLEIVGGYAAGFVVGRFFNNALVKIKRALYSQLSCLRE